MNFQVNLSDQTALVTGSGRGIGRAIVLALAQAGARVIVHYRTNPGAALAVVQTIVQDGGTAIAMAADLREPGQVQALFARIRSEMGTLNILVNNVGNFIMKSLSDTTAADWNDMIATNLMSTVYCTQAALPMLRAAGRGHIINLTFAGAARIQAYRKIVPYAIAKTGVLILTKSLAQAEACHHIRVNAVAPGLIQTDSSDAAMMARFRDQIPMGRPGLAQEVANAVLFLLSEQAGYITGTEIGVSGGWNL